MVDRRRRTPAERQRNRLVRLHLRSLPRLGFSVRRGDGFRACCFLGGARVRETDVDGVINITRAFVAAGALTLLATLWKVDDDETGFFMRRFYERLNGEANGDAAAAAVAMRECSEPIVVVDAPRAGGAAARL